MSSRAASGWANPPPQSSTSQSRAPKPSSSLRPAPRPLRDAPLQKHKRPQNGEEDVRASKKRRIEPVSSEDSEDDLPPPPSRGGPLLANKKTKSDINNNTKPQHLPEKKTKKEFSGWNKLGRDHADFDDEEGSEEKPNSSKPFSRQNWKEQMMGGGSDEEESGSEEEEESEEDEGMEVDDEVDAQSNDEDDDEDEADDNDDNEDDEDDDEGVDEGDEEDEEGEGGEGEEDGGDEEEGEAPVDELAEEMEQMPFGERQKVEKMNDGFAVEKLPKDQKLEMIRKEARRLQEKKKSEHRSKDMPAEMSSKIPVSRKRQVIHVHKRTVRDPRFDNLSGKFNEGMYKKAYSFLDDLKTGEMATLRKEIGKEKDPDQRAKLERALNIMEQRKAADERKDLRQQIKRDWRKEQEERVREGKKPVFLKKSQIRAKEHEAKFAKLQSEGRVDKFLEKRRKKLASKDRKKLPFETRVQED